MKAVAGLALVAFLAFQVYPMLHDFGVFRTLDNIGQEHCKRVQGIIGPEDIQVVDGIAFISSDDRSWFHGSGSEEDRMLTQVQQGAIYTLDVRVAGATPQRLEFQGYSHKNFHAHGIFVRSNGNGVRHVYVVNHRFDGRVVSLFTHSDGNPLVLVHITDVSSPVFRGPNDVVADGDAGFWVTNWIYEPRHTLLYQVELFGRRPWNYVSYCSRPAGFSSTTPFPGSDVTCRVVATGIRMANGMALSRDGKQVFVASSSDNGVFVYNVGAGGSLTIVKKLQTVSLPDNVDVDAVSGALSVGCHPHGLKFKAHADAADHAPPAPSEVIIATEADIKAATNSSLPFKQVFVDDGKFFPASTVGAFAGGTRMLIGQVFLDYFLDCEFPALAQQANAEGAAPDATTATEL